MTQFALNDDQTTIREMARAFAAEKLAPHALRWDEEKHLPVEEIRAAAALGMGGIYVREDVGGSGMTRLDAALIFESLAEGCPAVSAFISIHNMASWMIDAYGSDAQRRNWLPRLCTMELMASYCLTEPGAGSDAAALRTRAVRDGDHYVLNGQKQFISGAGENDLYVVMVRTGQDGAGGISTIVVERDAPGLSFGANERKMGWNAQPTRAVIFENCRVPVANLIGEEGEGFRIAMDRISVNRLLHCPTMIGLARQALRLSIDYAHHRQQFGGPISRFQAIQHMLADMATALYACEKMVLATAETAQGGTDIRTEASMCKVFVSERCFEIADKAVQIHGNVGVTRLHPVEFIFRRLRMWRIVTGTSEIQRNTIAKGILA
jgi:alkylation response protein AidB-like acyl-CoA dehydrogenase